VQVTYDPSKVSYGTLLAHFWRSIDPTDRAGQFCDKGPSYTTAVFVGSPGERRAAEGSRAAAERGVGQTGVTPIPDAGRFCPGEDYPQDYYKKKPLRYGTYRKGCGRDARLRTLWEGR